MAQIIEQVKLEDGTLIRHRVAGYEGRIDGTTAIKVCFTARGELLVKPDTKQAFQYRVAVKGESLRRIAPAEDLEILDRVTNVVCPRCHFTFRSKPGVTDKPGGRCQCGGWICPSCAACGDAGAESDDDAKTCVRQRKRLMRKLAVQKKRGSG